MRLFEYIDVLVCRSAIIAVGMPSRYSLPSEGSVKIGRNEGLVPYTMVCVTIRLTRKLVGCGGGIIIPGVVVKTNI